MTDATPTKNTQYKPCNIKVHVNCMTDGLNHFEGTGIQPKAERDFAKEAEQIEKLHTEHDYRCSWCGASPAEGEQQ